MKYRSFTFLWLVLIGTLITGSASATITGILKTCTPSPPGVTPAVNPSTTLTDSHTGGIWSSDNIGVATVGSATGVVYGVHSDSVHISYTYSGGVDVATVQVYGQPPGYHLLIGYACAGSTVAVTDDSVGTWTTSNTALATIASTGPNTALLYGVSTGFVFIYFTQTNTGCIFRNVDLDPTPVYGPGIIGGPSSVCVGSTITLTDSVTGGTWASNTVAIATIGNISGVLTGVSAGTDIITYSKFISPCTSITFTTKLVTVNALPVVSPITGSSSVCVGATTPWADATPGGVWSSGNSAIATVGPTGLVGGVAGGTTTITYAVTNSCGTVDSVKTITVIPLPVPGTISGPSGLCAGGTGISLTDAAPGGVWSSSSTGIATVGPTGTVTGVAGGTAIISYTVSNICGSLSATQAVAVSPLPGVSAIAGPSGFCAGSSITLTDATPGGAWSTSNPAVPVSGGVVTGASPASATISYSVSNSCGTTTVSQLITVSIAPVSGSITGATSMCQGTTIVLTDPAPGGVWSSSSAGVATVSASGAVTGLSGGSATIFYVVTNACGTATASQSILVNPLPVVSAIIGATGVCVGSSITLTDATPGGVWASTNPAIGVSGGVVTGTSPGTATISYSLTNFCGTVSATQSVTASTTPVAGTISGASSVCVGSAIALTDASPGGVWISSGTGIAVVGGTGIVTGLSAGGVTITYTVINACGTATATLPVTVNPLADAGTITGASSICAGGGTISLTDAVPGGVWSSSGAGSATVSSTGVVTITTGSAIISYSVTNACGTSVATKTITIDVFPDAGTITSASSFCVGATVTLADASAGGVWSSSAGLTITGSAGTVTGIAAGSAMVTYTVTNACGTATATEAITVNPIPVAGTIISITTIVCTGATITLTDATPGGIWASSSPIATVSAGVVTGLSAGVDIIDYSVTNSCGTAVAIKEISVEHCVLATNTLTNSNTELDVSPNPNEGTFMLTLSSNDDEQVQVTVMNMVGEKVKALSTKTNVAISIKMDVPPGIYFVSAITGQGKYVAKVVVN